MLNLMSKLLGQLQSIQTELEIEENNFKKVELNNDLITIKEKIDYFMELILKRHSKDDLFQFASETISQEKLNQAKNESEKANRSLEKTIDLQGVRLKEEKVNRLNEILSKNPDAENEENKETSLYKTIKLLRKDIKEHEVFIENQTKKLKSFASFLQSEDKINLVNKLINTYDIDNQTKQEILNEVNDFKSSIDIEGKLTYPVKSKVEELISVSDDLSEYLLKNKENIDRLTVVSKQENISKYFTKKVIKIEDELALIRRSNFQKYAKDNKIDDIVISTGQFDGKKIFNNNEDNIRYNNCIKELELSNDTKTKFKELLKEFDSLGIVDGNLSSAESINKEYGFSKFLTARKEFISAINKEPKDKDLIKNSLEKLKEEETKILKTYSLIRDKLGDDYETMPGNVDSFRNIYVPPCFKQSLSINAKFNSLFIMLSFVKEQGLSIDEFVDNPVTSSEKCLQQQFNNNNIDSVLRGKSKSEALLYLSDISKQPSLIDPIKYTRSYELLENSEKNEEYKKNNSISTAAVRTKNGNINRALSLGMEYFNGNTSETIQNILIAEKDAVGRVSYFDCYVSDKTLQINPITGVVLDEKATVIEKVNNATDIVDTFYNAVRALKEFTDIRKNQYKNNNITLKSEDVFKAMQELAVKITLTYDLTSKKAQTKYPKSFIDDVFNMITDYKSIEDLKDLNFNVDIDVTSRMINLINDKNKMLKTLEKQMIEKQKQKEDSFIKQFERINKEIDILDARADKIGKKLDKGHTNKEIEEIALLQQRKFQDLLQLQNSRLDELRKDVEKGYITKHYFEKRVEQVKLLSNIKEIPSMFVKDDKNYKDFKTYAKEVLKINIKTCSSDDLANKKEQYKIVVKQLEEEKRLFLNNQILVNQSLSTAKAINSNIAEKIDIKDNFEEMKNISNELVEKENRVQIQLDLEDDFVNNESLQVDEEYERNLINEKII